MPVMEGKAALFKRFADIDAWPICLDTQDTDEIVRAVELIAPGFGGINLEDIAAPRCFEIERRLRESLDIPVFHDDQHGTAIVVLAALTNALRVVKKELTAVRVVVSGGGAAGTAIVTLLLAAGVTDVVVVDRAGALSADDEALSPVHRELAAATNPRRVTGDLHTVLAGADVFIGVSAPGVLKPEWIQEMAPDAVVFALANPDPEVDPAEADKYAAVVASGRSDYPNQINNVLAFPGVFRGLLDARASQVTIEMLLRAADAIAHVVKDDELNPNFIIPTRLPPRRAQGGRRRRQGSGSRSRSPIDLAGPPEPVPQEYGERRHQHGAHDQRVEQYADADDRAELGQHDQRQHPEHGEDRRQQDARAGDHAAGDGQSAQHALPRAVLAGLLAGPGDQEDVVVDARARPGRGRRSSGMLDVEGRRTRSTPVKIHQEAPRAATYVATTGAPAAPAPSTERSSTARPPSTRRG